MGISERCLTSYVILRVYLQEFQQKRVNVKNAQTRLNCDYRSIRLHDR